MSSKRHATNDGSTMANPTGSPSRAGLASGLSSFMAKHQLLDTPSGVSSSGPAAASQLAASSRPAVSPQPATTDSSVPTDLHDIQLRYKLAPTTFKTLCSISSPSTRRDILQKSCFAAEFRSFPIKQTERAFFREINDHSAIPYPITENISQPWHKVFLLVQIDLQRGGWPPKISAAARKELHQERGRIYIVLDRVLRCLADILGQRHHGRDLVIALDVLRSVKSGVWEGNNMELLQVEGIGPAKMAKLVQAGVKTIKQLGQLDFFHIERLLSRNPPFGHQMLHQLAGFPVLSLHSEVVGQYNLARAQVSDGAESGDLQSAHSLEPLWITRFVLGYDNGSLPAWNKRNPWTTLVVVGSDGRLVWFWRGSVKRLVGSKEMVVGLRAAKGEQLKVAFACEEIVGTALREELQV